jgi:bacterial leucyl aminopeptidase
MRPRETPLPAPQPVADFGIGDPEPTARQTVQFQDASSDAGGAGIAWRAWDFGDGATATGAMPAHRYRSRGTYDVTLTVATFDGRVATVRRTIVVAGRAFPNAKGGVKNT